MNELIERLSAATGPDADAAIESAAQALKSDFIGRYMSDDYRRDVVRQVIAALRAHSTGMEGNGNG